MDWAMKRQRQSPEKRALQRSFHRWAAIVELFAQGRPGRKRVNGRTYVELHRDLIAECRLAAASASEIEAPIYRSIEVLAQPWLEPAVLDRTDREILFDLLSRCRRIERELGVRVRSGADSWRALAVPLLVVFLCVASSPLWVEMFSDTFATIVRRARIWSGEVWYNVGYVVEAQWPLLIACALLVVSICLVARAARR
jgi:hypothetical protein